MRVLRNKMSIKVSKPREDLNILDRLESRPIDDYGDSEFFNIDAVNCDFKT